MPYQINGTEVINQSRVLKNLVGYEGKVVTLASESGSGTTTCDLNLGNCFVITMTSAMTSAKTISFTNHSTANGVTDAIVFIKSTAAGTPGTLTFSASGHTIRTTDGATFTKPVQNQLDAYVAYFWGPGADCFITYAMRDIS